MHLEGILCEGSKDITASVEDIKGNDEFNVDAKGIDVPIED